MGVAVETLEVHLDDGVAVGGAAGHEGEEAVVEGADGAAVTEQEAPRRREQAAGGDDGAAAVDHRHVEVGVAGLARVVLGAVLVGRQREAIGAGPEGGEGAGAGVVPEGGRDEGAVGGLDAQGALALPADALGGGVDDVDPQRRGRLHPAVAAELGAALGTRERGSEGEGHDKAAVG